MSFVMKKNLLFIGAVASLLVIAACSKKDEGQANAKPEPAPAVEPQPAPPAVPADKGPDLINSLMDNSGVMTPEEKAAAIQRARNNAEAAAKAVGQSVEDARLAGEAAQNAALRSLQTK